MLTGGLLGIADGLAEAGIFENVSMTVTIAVTDTGEAAACPRNIAIAMHLRELLEGKNGGLNIRAV